MLYRFVLTAENLIAIAKVGKNHVPVFAGWSHL